VYVKYSNFLFLKNNHFKFSENNSSYHISKYLLFKITVRNKFLDLKQKEEKNFLQLRKQFMIPALLLIDKHLSTHFLEGNYSVYTHNSSTIE